MHISFTPHNTEISTSCKNVIEYLEKENNSRDNEFENILDEYEELKESKFDEQIGNQNKFFTNTDEVGNEKFVDSVDATDAIDNNLSSRAKDKESKFFMLNISPSKEEIEHLNLIVDKELEFNGFGKKEIDILNKSEQGRKQIEIMRNDFMHQAMREYTRDVMEKYAENFNRKVYANPEKLPNQKEEKIINKYAKDEIEKLKIDKSDNQYSEKYQQFREEKARELGKDLSMRPMEAKDLVWFGKVEELRTYKANDKWVIENKKINKQIKEIEGSNKSNSKKQKEIEELKGKLFKDRTTGEEVREGLKKGGQQYHVHVVVSRYDNCPNTRFKNSISPLAKQKNSKMADKSAQVGFNRDTFFKSAEKSFDEKFMMNRVNSYEKYNYHKKQNNELKRATTVEKVSKGVAVSIKNQITQPIKSEVIKSSGLHEVMKLNPNNQISKELGFKVPMSIPKTPQEVAFKIISKAVSMIKDASRGY